MDIEQNYKISYYQIHPFQLLRIQYEKRIDESLSEQSREQFVGFLKAIELSLEDDFGKSLDDWKEKKNETDAKKLHKQLSQFRQILVQLQQENMSGQQFLQKYQINWDTEQEIHDNPHFKNLLLSLKKLDKSRNFYFTSTAFCQNEVYEFNHYPDQPDWNPGPIPIITNEIKPLKIYRLKNNEFWEIQHLEPVLFGGSIKKNSICLKDKITTISGQHGQFGYQDQRYYIQDNGSTYGTFLEVKGYLNIKDQLQFVIGNSQFFIEKLEKIDENYKIDFNIYIIKENSTVIDLTQKHLKKIVFFGPNNNITIDNDQDELLKKEKIQDFKIRLIDYGSQPYLVNLNKGEDPNPIYVKLITKQKNILEQGQRFILGDITEPFQVKGGCDYFGSKCTGKEKCEENLAFFLPCHHKITCLKCFNKNRPAQCLLCGQQVTSCYNFFI